VNITLGRSKQRWKDNDTGSEDMVWTQVVQAESCGNFCGYGNEFTVSIRGK
jgi:hypothetical protein